MKIKWLGHACFLVTSEKGTKIVIDPYSAGSGLNYAPVGETADIVIVSHGHPDHNNVEAVKGKPEVLKDRGVKTVKGIQFKGIASYHDESQGKQRGSSLIYCFSVDGVRLCHLGDLGHKLSPEQANEIGTVDVLFIPVGGFFTIDAAAASQVLNQIKPRVTIPMHYKTPKCDYPIAGVEEFLKGKQNIKRSDSSELDVRPDRLPAAGEIVVLKPAL